MKDRWGARLLAAVLGIAAGAAHTQVDVERYLRKDRFGDIAISPDGTHLAAIAPMADRTALSVLRRADKRVVASTAGDAKSHVAAFAWADDRRVVLSLSQAFGSEHQPYLTGEIYALDYAENRGKRIFDLPGADFSFAQAALLDGTPEDPDGVLLSSWRMGANPKTLVERVNPATGRSTVIATAPVRRASFVLDAKATPRFAMGYDAQDDHTLHHRSGPDAPWALVNDEGVTGVAVSALGLSADGAVAYLLSQRKDGPDAIEGWNPATGARTTLLEDPDVDPSSIVYDLDDRTPIGARYVDGEVRLRFFDEAHPTARIYRGLEKAFKGTGIAITSATRDRRLAVVRVWSDRIPGDYYLYDTHTRKADGIYVSREWFHPDTVPATTAVRVPTRDGLTLHGWLTTPRGRDPKALPLVLMPHGGPFGVADQWGFDPDTVMLAEAGYAVLRVNFRGSAGRGRAFQHAGARQWGGTMQDDLTDATRWAIQRGLADPGRICIVGASYGGYAALMGAAKEPGLYRCAVGYVGVYDLVEMTRDDRRAARWLGDWSQDWVGAEDLDARSPVNLADRIRAPVLLVAGGADPIAPKDHTTRMERALRRAGRPVETLYVDSEGHGFTDEANRRTYYTRLLAFLSTHLGGATAASPAR